MQLIIHDIQTCIFLCLTHIIIHDNIAEQSLRIVYFIVISGASSGIGAETARVLALHGVHVVMAVRSLSSGNVVKEAILKETPAAKVDVMELDLASMESVRKFASEYNSRELPLNLLM